METDIKSNINPNTTPEERHYRHQRSNRVAAGLILLAVGVVLAARQAGAALPEWLFTWQMIVIVVGIYIGIKERFRDLGWLIIVAVGATFLADRFIDSFTLRDYMWPIIIIAIGLTVMYSRRGKNCW